MKKLNTALKGALTVFCMAIAGLTSIAFAQDCTKPGTPLLLNPSNNSVAQSTTPVFSWSTVDSAKYYILEISTSADFSSGVITITDITNTSDTLTTPLDEFTVYYWRVAGVNDCGTGEYAQIFSFKTAVQACTDYMSTDVPIFIDSIGKPQIVSTLNVPFNIVISDVNVIQLKGTHTYVSDLTFTLKSPQNTSVILYKNACDGEQDFDMNLDDESNIPYALIPCPPTGGATFQPYQLLSAYDGQLSQGTWTLTVKDNSNEDGGELQSWGLKICSSDTTLPVSWLSFTGEKTGNSSVALRWAVTNQINNSGYSIERSTDAIHFSTLGFMPAERSETGTQIFFYTDNRAADGINYYRLKQIDKDGAFQYSTVVKVSLRSIVKNISVYPNPAVAATTIEVIKPAKKLLLTITDASGKMILKKEAVDITTGQRLSIPLTNITPGIYFISTTLDNEKSVTKLIKQ